MVRRKTKASLATEQAKMRARIKGLDALPAISSGSVQYWKEDHKTIPELAKAWAKSAKTIRRECAKEKDGVIRVGINKITMSVSESAARRIYERLSHRR